MVGRHATRRARLSASPYRLTRYLVAALLRSSSKFTTESPAGHDRRTWTTIAQRAIYTLIWSTRIQIGFTVRKKSICWHIVHIYSGVLLYRLQLFGFIIITKVSLINCIGHLFAVTEYNVGVNCRADGRRPYTDVVELWLNLINWSHLLASGYGRVPCVLRLCRRALTCVTGRSFP